MSALGLVGYGNDEEEDEEEEESSDSESESGEILGVEASQEAARLDSDVQGLHPADVAQVAHTVEHERALPSFNERGTSSLAYVKELSQRNSKDGDVAMLDSAPISAPLNSPGVDGNNMEASPMPQQHLDGEGHSEIPTGPPWNVHGIPDAPEDKCDMKWQERTVWVLAQQNRTGKQMVVEMQCNPNYRNPRFMEKDIHDKRLFQYGTCFPPDVWDPRKLPSEDFLRNVRLRMKEQIKKARTATPAKAPLPPAVQRTHPANLPASAAHAPTSVGSKRSKWDQTR